MSFQGPDPYGTSGGVDNYSKPMNPEDIRVAETRMLVVFMRVNGPIALKNRENLEDVIRILDFGRFQLTVIIRSNGTVVDNAAGDLDFKGAFELIQPAPGIVEINIIDGGILTDMLADLSVTLGKLAANSVDSSKIVDGSIVNADINAAAAIDGSKLANLSVVLGKLAANSVDSSKIVDGSIVNADINAAAAIAKTKLAALDIVNADVNAAAAIDGSKLANTSIALGKLAANSVDSSKIVDGSIVNADINAAAAIAGSKLAFNGSRSAVFLTVTEVVGPSGHVWVNMPAAGTILLGFFGTDTICDLDGCTEFRLKTRTVIAGAAGSRLQARYWNGAAYVDLANVAGAGDVAISTAAQLSSGWIAINPAAAINNVLIAVYGVGGNGVADPSFSNTAIEFR